MNQFHGNRPQQRGIDSHTSRHKPGALDKIVSLTKLLYKPGHILYAVLIISVDSYNALITSLQGPPHAHTKLCTLFPGILLHKQGIHVKSSEFTLSRASIL